MTEKLSPACRAKTNCFNCRNTKAVWESFQKQFSIEECPLGIPFGADMAQMPEETKEFVRKQEVRKENFSKAPILIKELRQVTPETHKASLEVLVSLIFPNGIPTTCKYMENTGKTVRAASCGCSTFIIVCHHPEGEKILGEGASVLIARQCTKEKCRFFTPDE